jgi:hypothetical protein
VPYPHTAQFHDAQCHLAWTVCVQHLSGTADTEGVSPLFIGAANPRSRDVDHGGNIILFSMNKADEMHGHFDVSDADGHHRAATGR